MLLKCCVFVVGPHPPPLPTTSRMITTLRSGSKYIAYSTVIKGHFRARNFSPSFRHDDEDAWERATLVGGPDYWGDDGRDDDWYGAGDDDDWGDDGDDNIEEDDVFGDADAASVASTNYQDEDDEYFHDAENEGELNDVNDDDNNYDYLNCNDFQGDAPADFEGEGSDDDQEAWGGEDWSRSVGGDEDDQVWDDADNWVAGYTHWENDWGDE